MSNLNPDQFGEGINERREDFSRWSPGGEYYHGTDHASAEKIAEHGFSLDHQANGRSSGDGIYLHHNDRHVRQYGPATVAVELDDHLKIHENPFQDEQAMKLSSALARGSGGDFTDHLPRVLHHLGYHGHHDPDDNSTVVYDPKNVHYLTHYDPRNI